MFPLKPTVCEVNLKGFHSVYYFEFGKEFSHTPEKHNYWEMVYVDKGKVIAVTDGIGAVLEQGQVIFHEPGELHTHIANKKVSNNMLVVSFSVSGQCMDFIKKKTFTLDKTLKTLLALFISETKNALNVIPSSYDDKEPIDFSKELFGASQLMECYFSEFLIRLIRKGTELGEKISSASERYVIAQNSTAELIAEFLEKMCMKILLSMICAKDFVLAAHNFQLYLKVTIM